MNHGRKGKTEIMKKEPKTDFSPETILSLYFEKEPRITDTLDLCRGDDDFRTVCFAEDGDRKLVIKHTSNSFTDMRRIESWARLIDEYNSLGIYCPRIVKNRLGETAHTHTEDGRKYYIYAEEFSKYPSAEKIGIEKPEGDTGRPIYTDDVLRSVGKVAAARLDCCDFPSVYCLLEPYSADESTDEGTGYGLAVRDFVYKELPAFRDRMDRLMELFYKNQEQLRMVYYELPTSCFQADLNYTNILLDENNNFAGVIDFNLCGREVNLNYAVRAAMWMAYESRFCGENDEYLFHYDEELDEARDAIILENLKLIGENYEYSEKERAAFPVLFRYMNSFWWDILSELKSFKDDERKVDMLFRWLEKQLTRDDMRLP